MCFRRQHEIDKLVDRFLLVRFAVHHQVCRSAVEAWRDLLHFDRIRQEAFVDLLQHHVGPCRDDRHLAVHEQVQRALVLLRIDAVAVHVLTQFFQRVKTGFPLFHHGRIAVVDVFFGQVLIHDRLYERAARAAGGRIIVSELAGVGFDPLQELVHRFGRVRHFGAVIREHYRGRAIWNGIVFDVLHRLRADFADVRNVALAQLGPYAILDALGNNGDAVFVQIDVARAFACLFGRHDAIIGWLGTRSGRNIDQVYVDFLIFLFKHRNQRIP
ncbi:hypothetical protein D1872_237360 [compost metagenome]